jgi:nucleotide-binding universal stress UspA family protein
MHADENAVSSTTGGARRTEERVVSSYYLGAVEDFRRARRQAALEEILARLTGRRTELLRFDDVQQMLGTGARLDRGLQDIPLDAIVGSVGRYADFTRTFLPRTDSLEHRWAQVKTLAVGEAGWPPIEVYRVGDVYFVLDGNHRVSVARQMGLETIPAYVTEIRTTVPLSPGDDPDEVIIKARRADFLGRTNLQETRPDAELLVTAPGAYRILEEHIRVHRYYMGLEQQREIGYEEAAAHWYDTVYEPVAAAIREHGLLAEFPDRTETDLYLWLAEHRAELEEELGWEVRPGDAAEDLAARSGRRSRRMLARVGERLRSAVLPGELEPGPPSGIWRTRRVAGRHDDRLFVDIMVTINGAESGWAALTAAITVAQREQTTVRGIHVVADAAGAESEAVAQLRDRFFWQVHEVGLAGDFVVETGSVPRVVCDRGRWNDLVVLPVTYPPGRQPLQYLGSGLRQVIARCSRPMLAIPAVTPMQNALLVYNGSAESEEALFVATYLAARWQIGLAVVIVANADDPVGETVTFVGSYLREHGIEAPIEVKTGAAVETALAAGEDHDCDLIVIGGYSQQPVLELIAGSVLTELLRAAQQPILIAR